MKKKILVVDDDPHIRDVVCFAINKAGFSTVEAADGQQALAQFDSEKPDLLVLDIGLSEFDGTEVCRRLRLHSKVPIVFLTAKDEEVDRIIGLELGGDDYVTKPFSPRELVARIKAIFRRVDDALEPPSTATHQLYTQGYLTLDPQRFLVTWKQREVTLTATEFGIVKAVMERPGHVFSREALMNSAYSDHVVVSDRTIDSHIRRVRNKFKAVGGDPIETVHGVGYKLNACNQSSMP